MSGRLFSIFASCEPLKIQCDVENVEVDYLKVDLAINITLQANNIS